MRKAPRKGWHLAQWAGLSVAGVALFFVISAFSSCRNDHVVVDKKDAKGPQFDYRLDELALLQMVADDVQDHEKDKKYAEIYDSLASQGLKQTMSRRLFLVQTNCVETYLGEIEEFNQQEIGFKRSEIKSPQGKSRFQDALLRTVKRSKANLQEDMRFINDGVGFKLDQLSWISADKGFQRCIANRAKLAGESKPETTDEQAAKTAVDNAASADNASTESRAGRTRRQRNSGEAELPTDAAGMQSPSQVDTEDTDASTREGHHEAEERSERESSESRTRKSSDTDERKDTQKDTTKESVNTQTQEAARQSWRARREKQKETENRELVPLTPTRANTTPSSKTIAKPESDTSVEPKKESRWRKKSESKSSDSVPKNPAPVVPATAKPERETTDPPVPD